MEPDRTNTNSSRIDALLDRMSAVSDQIDEKNAELFVASSTWEGARPGYFFGTGAQGTGYYEDKKQQEQQSSSKRKRSVRIVEELNEMKFVPKASLLDQAEKEALGSTVIELTAKGIRSASNTLSKIANQNAIERAQFADQPRQYMESELALYEQVTALQAIAADVQLYKNLIESEVMISTLVELLSHQNTDVCSSVVSVFLEWIDPVLLVENPDLISVLGVLASRILEEGWEAIVSNLTRFSLQNDSEDDIHDQSLRGIDNSLSLMENLLEIDLRIPDGLLGAENNLSAAAFMVKETKILSWFFQMIGYDQSTAQLKGRCLELLAFLAQREDVHTVVPDWSHLPLSMTSSYTGEKTAPKLKKGKHETIQGIEILLQCIGAYRKTQPRNTSEVEFLENACIVLSSCTTFSETNLKAFLEGQGIELVLRCLKERVHAGGSGLKLLDFFHSSAVHKIACERLVTAGVLKYLFPIFLNCRIPKPAPSQATTPKAKREWLNNVETQTIRVLYALSHHLDDASPEDGKARFLTKFVEDDRKCDRLVELLLFYDQKARKAEFRFYRSDLEERVNEEETVQLAALDAKLKGGGDLFHRLGAIISCICVHSKRCHQRILSQLQLQQSGISLVRVALEEFISLLGDGAQKEKFKKYLENL